DDGRAIATALSRDEVYARVRRAALLLLRSERCVVLVRAPAIAELTPVHGDVGVPYSRQIVRRALEAGRTIALSTAEVQRDATSQRSGARSILCIPIRVRGEAHACLYLTHAEVDDLFGESERRIGDFLGTLAGAALENADGFARLEALSRELERRVDE